MKHLFRFLKTRYPDLLPGIIHAVLNMLHATLRVRLVHEEVPRGFHRKGEGIIQVMWHARLGLGPFAYQGQKASILISSHGDGEIIARVTGKFGFGHIRGSSSKGGGRALKQMLLAARNNEDLVLTPDGPRGPAEVAKPGVAQIAKMTGLPVIPFAFSASPCLRLRSWDRFMIPLPFARTVLVWGEPLSCASDEEVESFQLRVEEGLKKVTATADDLVAR